MTNLLSKPNRLSTYCVQLRKSFHFNAKNRVNYKLKTESPLDSILIKSTSFLFNKYNYTNYNYNFRLIHTTKPQASIKNQVKVFYFIYNALQYAFVFTVAAGLGLITGYFFSSPDDESAQSAMLTSPPVQYEATRIVSGYFLNLK